MAEIRPAFGHLANWHVELAQQRERVESQGIEQWLPLGTRAHMKEIYSTKCMLLAPGLRADRGWEAVDVLAFAEPILFHQLWHLVLSERAKRTKSCLEVMYVRQEHCSTSGTRPAWEQRFPRCPTFCHIDRSCSRRRGNQVLQGPRIGDRSG